MTITGLRHRALSALSAFGLTAALMPFGASADAARSASEQENLALVLRQLDMIERVALRSDGQPVSRSARYHFDYQRLQSDLEQIRQGINGYLSPSRAQPRDPGALSGHYTRTGSDQP